MPIRLIDTGTVPCLRSQTLYHALARVKTSAIPDTVIFAAPAEPYVCIGFHQELEREIDVLYCKANGIPVVRRETGGRALYLDKDQLFVQWIFGQDRLRWRLESRFALFAGPLVQAYRALGISAKFCPANDIQVAARKTFTSLQSGLHTSLRESAA